MLSLTGFRQLKYEDAPDPQDPGLCLELEMAYWHEMMLLAQSRPQSECRLAGIRQSLSSARALVLVQQQLNGVRHNSVQATACIA
mmetsp:Transcript_2591/g.4791  ORF Transcript_2591/g.4791 Transcript_2591/m.4791 type:complete len:85 (-) Transcript_2591:130-384(-)